jgi:hypothetical protein
MSPISIKDVLIGVAVDVGGSKLATLVFGIAAAASCIEKGIDPRALHLETDPLYLTGALVAGLFFTCAGGFTTSILAHESKVLNAGLVGVIDTALSIPFFGSMTLVNLLAVLFLTIPCAVLGGMLGLQLKPSNPELSAD